MTTEIVAGALGELRAASTAGGGTALTTTAGYIYLPLYARHLIITPRNFATAVVAKVALNPWLTVLKTVDNLLTAPQDFSEQAQDGNAATDVNLSELPTLANKGFLLVGSHLPFRGVYCDVDSANAVTSTLTVAYWNGAWTSISATDNTASGGATMAVDGTVTWTVPAAWKAARLNEIYRELISDELYADFPMFWTRWVVSAALTANTSLNNMAAMNRSTAYAELLSGQTLEETIAHGFSGIGCVEALVDAGTANLVVNVASIRNGRFK